MNGTWQVAPYAIKPPPNPLDLMLIRTDTPNAGVEVAVDYLHIGPDGAPAWTLHSSFAIWQGPWALGRVSLWCVNFLRGSAYPDLVFIQTKDTDKVHVQFTEYHQSSGQPATDYRTLYPGSLGESGTWLMADMEGKGDRPPDLVFIQTTKTTSGVVELSYATGGEHVHGAGPPTGRAASACAMPTRGSGTSPTWTATGFPTSSS